MSSPMTSLPPAPRKGDAPPAHPPDTRPRPLIGERYEVERTLAEGGMGTIYVARHAVTRQTVALKVLDRRFALDDASRQRFLREVTFAGRIQHPGIVKVYDAGVHTSPEGQWLFLAMELLAGETLAQHLARGRASASFALDVVARALEPLAAAHAEAIIHRDLKPENIFLEANPEGAARVRLIDFGIARSNDEMAATRTGSALGTVYYMPPEQTFDARKVTPASDGYAVGVILSQVLSGRYPFDGESPGAILIRAFNEAHVPLVSLCPDIDPRLASLVDRCLAKVAQDRPQSASALLDGLSALLADRSIRAWLDARVVVPDTFGTRQSAPPPAATPDPSPPLAALARPVAPDPSPPPRRRTPVIVAALALGALVVTAGAWLTLREPSPARVNAARAPVAEPAPAPSTPTAPAPTTPAEPPTATPEVAPAPVPAAPAVASAATSARPAAPARRVAPRPRQPEATAPTPSPAPSPAPTPAPAAPSAPASSPAPAHVTAPAPVAAPVPARPARPAPPAGDPSPPPFVTF